MSLLPEFNTHIYPKIFEGTCSESAGRRGLIMHAIDKLKDILNPDLNPLTFEEVKAWFDRKVAGNRTPFNVHILAGHKNAYRIIVEPISNKIPKAYFFLKENGFTQSSMDCASIIPYEPCAIFNLLPEGLVSTPLDLFCQMKGYVNI